MVNASIKILQKNIFLKHWPLGNVCVIYAIKCKPIYTRVKEKIKDAKAKDFRLQYFRKGTLITSGQDALRKLIFVKNGSCQVIRKMTTLCDKR